VHGNRADSVSIMQSREILESGSTDVIILGSIPQNGAAVYILAELNSGSFVNGQVCELTCIGLEGPRRKRSRK